MAAPMLKTYRWPPSVAGAGVDPTAAQMAQHDRLVVDLVSDSGGVNEQPAVIAHNMALSPADGSTGSPEVSMVLTTVDTVLAPLSVAFTDLNTLTFTKSQTGAGTGLAWRVTIKRPFSKGQ